jgi:hypothetical protein
MRRHLEIRCFARIGPGERGGEEAGNLRRKGREIIACQHDLKVPSEWTVTVFIARSCVLPDLGLCVIPDGIMTVGRGFTVYVLKIIPRTIARGVVCRGVGGAPFSAT